MQAGAASSAAPPRALRFSRKSRLRKRFEFRRVRDEGRRVHTPSFLVLLRPNEDATQRLGITVTKQVAGAVGRNRIKRVVREVFRRERALFPDGVDVVVVAKRDPAATSYGIAVAELSAARGAMRAALKRPERRKGATR